MTVDAYGDAATQFGVSSADSSFPGATGDQAEFDIDAVFSCAPTEIVGLTLYDTPMAIMMGYCDGDADLGGVKHYESSMYGAFYDGRNRDLAPKHLIYVMGANHAWFNFAWAPGGFLTATEDDVLDRSNARRDCHTLPLSYKSGESTVNNPLSGRLSVDKQLDVLDAYSTAFFNAYLKGDESGVPILTGEDIRPFPSLQLDPEDVLVSYTAPHNTNKRFDINRYATLFQLANCTGFGTPIIYSGFESTTVGGGPNIFGMDSQLPWLTDLNRSLSPDFDLRLEPHSQGFSFNRGGGAVRLVGKADEFGVVTYDVGNTDIGINRYDAFQFRVGLHFENTVNTAEQAIAVCESRLERKLLRLSPATNQSAGVLPDALLIIEFEDSDENTQFVLASDYSAAVFTPPGNPDSARLVMNQVRIPLSAFDDIDLSDLAKIRIVTINADLQISDLAFVSSDPFFNN